MRARDRLAKGAVLYAIVLLVTIPPAVLVSGPRATVAPLRIGLLACLILTAVSRLQWVQFPLDAAHLRRAIATALAAECFGAPILLAASTSGLFWVTLLGVLTAFLVYLRPISPPDLLQICLGYTIGLAVWLAAPAVLWTPAAESLRQLAPSGLLLATLSLAGIGAAAWAFQDAVFIPSTAEPPLSVRDAVGCGALLFPLAAGGLAYAAFRLNQPTWRALSGALLGTAGFVAGGLLGGRIGRAVGLYVANFGLSRVSALFTLRDYLADRTKLIGGFALGYGLIALWFAGAYAVLNARQPGSFRGLPADAGFGTFFYFSVITVATVGYGDILPTSGAARALVVAEIFLGIAWTTVVLAGVAWLIQTSPIVPGGQSGHTDGSRASTEKDKRDA